jgi:biopolymer transport protein ExbD
MNFEKPHRRNPPEPQLAAMIDVFSILIIFLIAGTGMDSSVLNIPGDLFLAETSSKSSSLNAPQVTLQNGEINALFINEKIKISDIEQGLGESSQVLHFKEKLKNYISKINKENQKNSTVLELLQSVNLVADKETPYREVFNTVKFFRTNGFQNTILVGIEGSESGK